MVGRPETGFALLGSLEVRGAESALGGVKQRAVLALLLLDANHLVTVDRLVAAVWEEHPPPSSRNTLQSYVSHLRRLLPAPALHSRPGGYLLETDPEAVDALRFERLLSAGRRALDDGDADAATALLAEGLGLWRGTALVDFEGWAFAEPPRARLEKLRLIARESLVAAELARGRHCELIGELEELLRAHPLREHLRGQLMTALYRAGRQADALAVYREGREVLADELGIEPGAELQRLERDILRQSAALAWEPPRGHRQPPNLPTGLSSFVGRDAETAAVRDLLRQARLVTLTGSAGSGKTRLAVHVATLLVEGHPDGAWFADLAPTIDPALVADAVAAAVGVPEVPQQPATETVVAHLRGRRALLVLDNCEHVVVAAAELAERLLRGCPDLRLLATSREPLRVPGEVAWLVPPLTVPLSASGDGAMASESVRLFVGRAAAVLPGFAPTAEDIPALAQICIRLDGIPLAIELAAARIALLSTREIAARLDDSLSLLARGSRTAVPRQRTLRAAVDWSHDLLSPAERQVLRRLAVFAGNFSLEAAEAVCPGEGIEAGNVLDLLAGLVDRSLVLVVQRTGHSRYRLLETMRQYSRRRLEEAAEVPAASDRHAAHYLSLAEQAARELRGPRQRAVLDRLELEHGDLRLALGWFGERADRTRELRLAGALWRWCHLRGHYREGRAWLERALARLPVPGETDPPPPAVAATANYGASVLAYLECDYPRAEQLCQRAHDGWLALHDQRGVGACLNALGAIARERGDYARAVELHEKSRALFAELGDDEDLALSLHAAGFALWLAGEPERAGRLCEQSLVLFRRLGDEQRIASVLIDLGAVAHYRGDNAAAIRRLEQGLSHSTDLGFKEGIAWACNLLGLVHRSAGAPAQAARLLVRSLTLHAELGDRWRAASVLEALAGALSDQREPHRPARLLGTAAALRQAVGTPLPPCERPAHDHDRAALLAALGPETFARLETEGTELTLPEALAEASASLV